METIDRLVRLLEKAEQRAVMAEETIRHMAASAAYAAVDSEELARNLAGVAEGQKIIAIKLHRQFASSSLKDAKDAVERYWRHPDQNKSETYTAP